MSGSREQMLARIRDGLTHSRSFLEAESGRASHIPPSFVHPPADDLAIQFATELTRLEGKVHRCADDEEALEAIAAILERTDAESVIGWNLAEINLPGLEDLLSKRNVTRPDPHINSEQRKTQLQQLEPVRACISGAECAIAESGTLLLRHGPGRPRIASLLAPTHIAVVRTGQLVRGLGEALALVRSRYGEALFGETSNLTLITGPSRTADIEMTLTLGIHGPKEINVVLIG